MKVNIGNIINMTIMIVILITIAEIQRAPPPNFDGQQLLQVAQSWQRWKNVVHPVVFHIHAYLYLYFMCICATTGPPGPRKEEQIWTLEKSGNWPKMGR